MIDFLSDPRLVAAVAVLLVTVGLHFLIKKFSTTENIGIWGLIVGVDGRVSTSRLQVVLWTYAVAFALLAIGISGNWEAGDAGSEGLGLDNPYLLLLGSPAAAALLAKTSTTYKVENGTIAKPKAKSDRKKNPVSRAGQGIMETISDDQGKVEVFDFQYFLFTLIALTFFFGEFLPLDLSSTSLTLPVIPEILVAMSGVSAAAYSVKKATERSVLTLTAVYPSAAAAGTVVLVRGKNLKVTDDSDSNEPDEDKTREPGVMFDGRKAEGPLDHKGGSFETRVPNDVGADRLINISFMRGDGVVAEIPFQVIVSRPVIRSTNQRKLVPDEDRKLRIFGYGFGEKRGIVTLDGRRLREIETWEDDEIVVSLLDLRNGNGFPKSGKVELIVNDAKGRGSEPREAEVIEERNLAHAGQTQGGSQR